MSLCIDLIKNKIFKKLELFLGLKDSFNGWMGLIVQVPERYISVWVSISLFTPGIYDHMIINKFGDLSLLI